MNKLKERKSIYIIVGIVLIIISVIICYVIEKNTDTNENTNNDFLEVQQENNTEDKNKREIIVHIIGEVKNPGIVEVAEGSRVKDVIEKAGGVTPQADLGRVNLAYVVQDEQKIVIPNIDEKKDDNTFRFVDESEEFIETESTSKININTATQSELEVLTGIGPSMASKIIDYRKQNGKFKTIDDIKNVPGIGDSKFQSIRDEICAK